MKACFHFERTVYPYLLPAMLFDKNNNKKIKIVWTVLCVLVIASMLLLYMPAFFS
jgi:hypothetical protein